MISYLQKALGVDVNSSLWGKAEDLPPYLKSGKEYQVLTIAGQDYLLIQMDRSKFQISAFLKQRSKISNFRPEQMILSFPKLDSRQRKALIENHIQFIVPGSQIYLPFLGVLLQERSSYKIEAPQKLSPMAQYLLLFFLYDGKSSSTVTKTALAKRLNMENMSVTRAVRELEALELVSVQKSGRSDYVELRYTGNELFHISQKYMRDPVQKRIFVKDDAQLDGLPLSGESALAQYAMLNPPNVQCRAIDRKRYKALQNIEEIDPAWSVDDGYIMLELWKYDPCTYADEGCVDRISLSLAMAKEKDERIESAIEEMMEGYQ